MLTRTFETQERGDGTLVVRNADTQRVLIVAGEVQYGLSEREARDAVDLLAGLGFGEPMVSRKPQLAGADQSVSRR